jgi:ATP-dependent DNA helicase RecG
MIANVFFRAGMIESWGRGIEKITDTCKNAGKREPTIEFKHNREFSVTFYSDVSITIKDTIKDTKNFQMSDTHSRLIAMMGENPRITVKAMAIALRINERNVKKHINALKELGRIERIGANKGGYWVVKLSD